MKSSKMFTYFLLGMILVTLEIIAVEGNGHKQRFGESCSRNKKCDFTKWLRCHEGKCVCFQNYKNGTINLDYDPVSDRCVGRSGANCSQKFYPFDDEDNHFFHMRGATTNHWRYGNGSLRCGDNAFCDFDSYTNAHTCNCRKNYYEADNGRCLRLRGSGDSCNSTKECDPDQFLYCDENVCGCGKTGHVFDDNSHKCVVKTGHRCETRVNRLDKRIISDDCYSNSFCETTSTPPVCRCHMGTQIHSDETCQRGWGQECDHDHPCGDTKLNCRSKVCQCKYPLHMRYDQITGQCVSIASGPCVFNDTSELTIQCTTNAECVRRGQFSECKCIHGFIQTADGDCVKVFGSHCEVDSECDRVGPLACINDHCECPDLFLRYDPKSRKCKGVVGSRCKLGEDSCVEHASCNKFEEVRESNGGTIGKCVCNRGYKESVNNTCSN